MSKVVVNLRLDKGLVERIDAAAGPRQRTKWIVAALEAQLAPRLPLADRVTEALKPPAVLVDPRPVPSVDPRAARPQFVRARTLVSPEIQSEWAEIMANRQARLNRKRDDAA